MNDKEKIDKALALIKSTQDFLENQRLEWFETTYTERHQSDERLEERQDGAARFGVMPGTRFNEADKLTLTYFEAQKALLEKLKKIIEE